MATGTATGTTPSIRSADGKSSIDCLADPEKRAALAEEKLAEVRGRIAIG
jgi:hypothetical protein